MVIEKETAREANSIDVSSTRKHGTPGSVAFTVIINNKSDNTATKGSVTIYDADSGDSTGVLFTTIPCGRLTLTHISLEKLKIIGRDTNQCFRIRVMPQEFRYPN